MKNINETCNGKTSLILKKVRVYAERYYVYAFPEEPFFQEIITQCISEAHGRCSEAAMRRLKMKDFWNYSKAKALDYVNNAIHEIQGPLPIPGQAHYYSLKINASAEKVLERLQQLKKQFEDTNDCLAR